MSEPTTRRDQWPAGKPRDNSAAPWTSAYPLNGFSEIVTIAINPIGYNRQMSVQFTPPPYQTPARPTLGPWPLPLIVFIVPPASGQANFPITTTIGITFPAIFLQL